VLRAVKWDYLLNRQNVLIRVTWLHVTLRAKIRGELYTDLRVKQCNYDYCKKQIARHVREFVRLWLTVYCSRNLLFKYFCTELNYYNYVRLKLFAALLKVSCTAVH
jgi:hypothetical protein